MKVLVIGATGYIGSHVARTLARHGHEVTGLARDESSKRRLEEWGLGACMGDARRVPELIGQARLADVTIFCPKVTLEEEYACVGALVDACKGSNRSFIFTSGTAVLGQRTAGAWSEDTFAEDEDVTPPKGIVMRVQAEQLVRNSAASGGRGMVVRPPMIWGHGRFLALEHMVASSRQTGSVCYVGDGLNMYSNVHVDDLAQLYVQLLDKGQAGALYHCVSGELNYRCIAECVARRIGCKTRSVSMDEAIDIWGKFAALIVMGASSRSRCPRARREIGWTPTRVDLVEELLHARFTVLDARPSTNDEEVGAV